MPAEQRRYGALLRSIWGSFTGDTGHFYGRYGALLGVIPAEQRHCTQALDAQLPAERLSVLAAGLPGALALSMMVAGGGGGGGGGGRGGGGGGAPTRSVELLCSTKKCRFARVNRHSPLLHHQHLIFTCKSAFTWANSTHFSRVFSATAAATAGSGFAVHKCCMMRRLCRQARGVLAVIFIY